MALTSMTLRATAGGFAIGYDWNSVGTDSSTNRITTAGKIAVMASLNSYYAGLTAAQKGQLDDNFYDSVGRGALVWITSQGVTAATVPGDGPTVADQIATALNTANNTVPI